MKIRSLAHVIALALAFAGCGPAPRSSAPTTTGAAGALEVQLREVGAAIDAGKFDEAMFELIKVPNVSRASPAYNAFRRDYEARVRGEADRRAAARSWGRAYVLASLGQAAFKSFPSDAYRTAWAEELRPAIAESEKSGRLASAVIMRAALASSTRVAEDAAEARRALEELRAKRRIALELAAPAGVDLRTALAGNTRFSLGGKRASERVVVTLGKATSTKNVTVGSESVRVEQGTRSVPNPQRADLEGRVASKEEELQYRRDELAMEHQSPSRTQGNIDMIKYQMSVIEGDLESLRRDLADTPVTLEEPNFVDMPFDVEAHTLTVSRDITIEVSAPWAGDLARQQTTAVVKRTDRAHAANRSLGIKQDPAQLPPPEALGPELDDATLAVLRPVLDKVAVQYYRHLADADASDGAALAIVLAPESARPDELAKVEQATTVPFADRMIHALVVDSLTRPFGSVPGGTTSEAAEVRTAASPAKSSPRSSPKSSPSAPASAPAPVPVPTKTAPASTTPAPSPPADPLRAKAGYPWKLAPFELERDGVVVAAVDASGTVTLTAGKRRTKTIVAVLRPGGIVEAPDGKAVTAIDRDGRVWAPRGSSPVGVLGKDTLAFTGAATLSIDAKGHVVSKHGTKTLKSEAVLSSRAPRPAALVVAWLAAGVLGMRDR